MLATAWEGLTGKKGDILSYWLWILLGAIALVAVVYVWALAVRLDRLHRRVASMAQTLQLTVIKRAAGSVQLATGGGLEEKEARMLLRAANRSLSRIEEPLPDGPNETADGESRYVVESELSTALRSIDDRRSGASWADNPLFEAIWEELSETRYGLEVSRTLYNQDVLLVRQLRSRPLVRVLHLAGFAPLPQYVDLDDSV